jgi:hypothetical protein
LTIRCGGRSGPALLSRSGIHAGRHAAELGRHCDNSRHHAIPSGPRLELTRLRNLGAVSADWLAAVGIRTEAELRALGAVVAFRRVHTSRRPAGCG